METDNYRSATNNDARPYVEAQIQEELDNGRYVVTTVKLNIISAIGAIPKNNSNTQFRLIHDASRPFGDALNDYADHNKFKYQSLQDAIDLINPGSFLGKVDLKNAFSSVGIHPSNYAATGLKWRFQGQKHFTYMIDTRLCFGGKRSPEIFNDLSQAVQAILASKGYPNIVAYYDDYLCVAGTFAECQRTMSMLIAILRELGFHINYNKVVGPSQKLTFLGIELDTITMTTSLPADKLSEVKAALQSVRLSDKMTKRHLQSIVGKLNWATQVIYGGRFHLRRLLDRINSLRYASHRTRVTRDMRADLAWWLAFMDHFNGTTCMVDTRPTDPVTIDACPVAARGHYLGNVCYTPWQLAWPSAAGLHINHKEVLALESAARSWAPLWANKRIHVYCDNTCAVYTMNKGISKKPLVMASLRRVFWLSAIYNFRIKAVYYPGGHNILADCASRLHELGVWQKLGLALSNTCYGLPAY